MDKLTNDDIHNIICDDHPEFTCVRPEQIIVQNRGSSTWNKVVKSRQNKFFLITWETYLIQSVFDNPNYEIVEVYPKEVTKTVYIKK